MCRYVSTNKIADFVFDSRKNLHRPFELTLALSVRIDLDARTGTQQTHGDAPSNAPVGAHYFGPIAESKCDEFTARLSPSGRSCPAVRSSSADQQGHRQSPAPAERMR